MKESYLYEVDIIRDYLVQRYDSGYSDVKESLALLAAKDWNVQDAIREHVQ